MGMALIKIVFTITMCIGLSSCFLIKEKNPLAKHLLEKRLNQGIEFKEEELRNECKCLPGDYNKCYCESIHDWECCVEWCIDCGWSPQAACIAACGKPDKA